MKLIETQIERKRACGGWGYGEVRFGEPNRYRCARDIRCDALALLELAVEKRKVLRRRYIITVISSYNVPCWQARLVTQKRDSAQKSRSLGRRQKNSGTEIAGAAAASSGGLRVGRRKRSRRPRNAKWTTVSRYRSRSASI